jgi:hypothetical protein
VPAAEIEKLVLEGVRNHPASGNEAEGACAITDRDLIVQRVHTVTIKSRGVEVRLLPANGRPSDDAGSDDSQPDSLPTTAITLPWTSPGFTAVKGILHSPSTARPTLRSESRDALLGAIAKARRWINDLRQGRIASFEDIAKQEGPGERHIRLLAPLAFISPRIISAIVEGTALQVLPSLVLPGLCRTPGLSRTTASVCSNCSIGSDRRRSLGTMFARDAWCPGPCPVSVLVEPVSGIAKRKLKNNALRLAIHTSPFCPHRL